LINIPINSRIFLAIIIGGTITAGIIYLFFAFGLRINKTQKEVQEPGIFNPALLNWQEITTTVLWSARDSHATAVYQDKIWILGGITANGFGKMIFSFQNEGLV